MASSLQVRPPRADAGLTPLHVEGRPDAMLRVRVADSAWSRLVGLLGCAGLPAGQGILIRPCSSVHTFGMRFPIDVVYLAADGLVVKVVHGLRPWRFSMGGRRARTVVELARGEAARAGIEPGVTVRWRA